MGKSAKYFVFIIIVLSALTFISILPFDTIDASPKTVRLQADTAFFANPGIGFQNLPGKNVVDESIIYRRPELTWNDLNPKPGKYNWKPIDDLITLAKKQNKQVAFRISTDSPFSKGHEVPRWVLDSGARMIGSEPDYSNCTYQETWGRFVDALRQRYDGNSYIAYIDIGGYGRSGEWPWNSQTQLDISPYDPKTLDGKARKRLANVFIGGADNTHICRDKNNHKLTKSYFYKGFQATQLVMPYAGIKQSIYYVVHKRSDVGIRFDCLGRANSAKTIMSQIGDAIAQVWKKAPVIFEFCNGGNSFDSLINESRNLLNQAHGSVVHDNINWNKNGGRIKSLVTNIGYKFTMKTASFPDTVSRNNKLSFDMIWNNLGTAPSYPKMGERFSLHLYLIDNKNKQVADWNIATNVSSWLPSDKLPGTAPDNKVSTSLTLPGNLQPGAYIVKVGIKNNRTGAMINLAIKNRDAAGRYTVGAINVR